VSSSDFSVSSAEAAVGSILLLELHEELDAIRSWALGEPQRGTVRPVPAWVHDAPPIIEGETPRDRFRRWAYVFADELDTVRRARNNVAHAIPLTSGDLASAVRIAGKLMLLARLSGGTEDEQQISFNDRRVAQALSFGEPHESRKH
jgi:hypothetical protein